MLGFGRRKKQTAAADESYEPDLADSDGTTGYEESADGANGPYDAAHAPADGISRLDLGSVRLPVPDDAQLQVELSPEGVLQAVHLMTPIARFTLSAFAAPRTDSLWREVSKEIADQFRPDDVRVFAENGEWGTELVAYSDSEGTALRFIGVDGPRWLLRAVALSSHENVAAAGEALREVLRDSIVVRGEAPMPVRTPLPIELPPAIAEHLAQAQG